MSYISTEQKYDKVYVWERVEGKRIVKQYKAPFYFFIESPIGEYKSIFGTKLKKIECRDHNEFNSQRAMYRASDIRMFESDLIPELKVLSENYYNAEAPDLHITFLDIEVDYTPELGFANVDNPYAPINSIALCHQWLNKMVVFAVPPEEQEWEAGNLLKKMNEIEKLPDDVSVTVNLFPSERHLLGAIIEEIEDSDVLSGWNSAFFDTPYIAKRLERAFGEEGLSFLSFEGARTPRFKEVEKFKMKNISIDIFGRISIDYLELYKKYEYGERPSYKLEAIADAVLPDMPKLEYEGTLHNLYRKNFPWFVRYNLRDTEVLRGFEKRLGYVNLANHNVILSTGKWEHVLGTLKLSELAINNYCIHELGLRFPDKEEVIGGETISGAYVLEPKVGMHDWIGSIDINSLYPSAIRSINVSPETLIGQFDGDIRDAEHIANGTSDLLNLVYEDGKAETHTAEKWREELWNRKWAVSGYGTVFDQNHKGIIPAILENWYTTRKHYQKLKAQAKDKHKKEYYDRLQYVYKIKLNSLYGALTNSFFRYYDLRMGESTTCTGRSILRHQSAETNKLLTGNYDYTGEAVLYGDSVSGDTKIILNEGKYHKIKDIFIETQHKINEKEYYFPKDLYALTYDKSINKSIYKPIKYVMRHIANKKMFRVWLTNSNYIDVTEDHSLIGYLNTQKRRKNEDFLIETKPSDIGNRIKSLVYLKNIPRNNIITKNYPKEIYELMGYIIGDGYIETCGNIGLSVGNIDINEVSDNLLYQLKKKGYITSFSIRKNAHDVRIYGKKAYDILKENLYQNRKKQIPEWIFDEKEENICGFIRGYFSADGTVINSSIILCSTNDVFIKKIQHLLFLCGISSSWFTENTENNYLGKYSGTYTKRLNVKNTEDFKDKIGFIQSRKQNKIKEEGKERKFLSQYDFTISRPIKIEEINYNGYVYDIEIEDTHTFFANNILVHNTDSTYFNLWAKDEDEAVLIADTCAERVNKTFQNFMRKTFLCQPEFDNIIKAGRENVASRGIFVQKKLYILRVVDSEGDKVDKLKIMGLQIKKTTLPAKVGKDLSNFIGRLLRGEDWHSIAEDIVAYKEMLENTDDYTLIGLPKGVKKVESYTADYKADPKCRLPGHVAAAIHYNICREKYKDHESPIITSGMKIRVFYITDKRENKFISIALPTDLEVIPEWFKKEFKVDRKKHIIRLIDMPLEGILHAIGKDVPSAQSLLLDELLVFDEPDTIKENTNNLRDTLDIENDDDEEEY